MSRLAIQLVDLGFGDSGKGSLVDYLVREHGAELVVRFNGGPQAGHNVVLPDGRHHTFAQFGSGMFVAGSRTVLSRAMLIEPYAMLNEARHLASIGVSDAMQRTWIDERCRVIAPPHQIANRIRERAGGAEPHGTCGMGVGECAGDSIDRPDLCLRAADLHDKSLVQRKMRQILDHKRAELDALRCCATADELRVLDNSDWIDVVLDVCSAVATRVNIASPQAINAMIRETRVSIFEGAQGVLLDERYGFHPHTTWSRTTFADADAVLEEASWSAARQRIGVIRTYMTRHGAGPFPTHNPALASLLPEPHNDEKGWQGSFRRGVLDLVLLRYALEACDGVDVLAVTHLDRLSRLPPSACDAYLIGDDFTRSIPCDSASGTEQMQRLGQQLDSAVPIESPMPTEAATWRSVLEECLQVPVGITSTGPTFREKAVP